MNFDDLIHMRILETEIGILESRYEEHDTGHIRTAVNVLQRRVEEIETNIRKKI
jgi:hypothetical protein|tara:strand:- start:1279 stop:1440 length:162 start_codon:yes stop_codon:yes gene_type:complete